MARLEATDQGLAQEEAGHRRDEYRSLQLNPDRKSRAHLLLAQFNSPIILILVFAAGLSFFLGGQADALIILTIILLSALLGFSQERGAALAIDKLLAMVQTKAEVRRDGAPTEVPIEEIVPGDIINISAGATIPGDCLLVEAKNLFIDEATLTGETYPAEKAVGVLQTDIPLAQRTNSLLMGTHVVSGMQRPLSFTSGKETEFGQVSERSQAQTAGNGIRTRHPAIWLFPYGSHVGAGHSPSSPSMSIWHGRFWTPFSFRWHSRLGSPRNCFPAIISINLAHGAKRMAQHKVIVKRLASIENFGSMNVICSDKTGTLTEGIVRLQSALDVEGSSQRASSALRLSQCVVTRPALRTRSMKPSAAIDA